MRSYSPRIYILLSYSQSHFAEVTAQVGPAGNWSRSAHCRLCCRAHRKRAAQSGEVMNNNSIYIVERLAGIEA